MSQFYSDPERESDKFATPDCEVFQLTAHEVAAQNEDLIFEYTRRHKFRLAGMNSRARGRMLDAIVEEQGVCGGWFYWYCFPGCMPERPPIGPFPDAQAAIKACQDDAAEVPS